MPLPDGRPTASELTRGVPNEGDRYNPYAIHPQVVKRTREVVEGSSRRCRRRALALAAQVTYLAVMDPDSGASTQDRLKAADGAARVSGLTRDDQVKVAITFTMRGWGTPPTKVIDAAPVSPIPGGDNGARGEGG